MKTTLIMPLSILSKSNRRIDQCFIFDVVFVLCHLFSSIFLRVYDNNL